MDEAAQNATKRDTSDEIDRKLVALVVTDPTITDEELGRRVGLSRSAVNRRRSSQRLQTLFKEAIPVFDESLSLILRKAMQTANDLLSDPDPRIRATASLSLLRLFSDQMTIKTPEPAKPIARTYVTCWGELPE